MQPKSRNWEWLKTWEALLGAILVIVVIINIQLSSHYLNVNNLINVFHLSIEKAIVALIMTCVIINGEIDLSVASVMALGGAVFAYLYHDGVAPGFAILAALGVGMACGAFNGLWIAYAGLPSLAVTLAGWIGYRGIARILLGNSSLGDFPKWFTDIAQKKLVGPLPVTLVFFMILFGYFAVILHYSAFARSMYITSKNREEARFSAVVVRQVKWIIYIGLPALTLTLAGWVAYWGIAHILLGDFPQWSNDMPQEVLVDPLPVTLIFSVILPVTLIFFAILFGLFTVILHYSVFGRYIYIIGNNREAARFSGVAVRQVKMGLFVTSGLVASLAGVLYVGRLGSVRTNLAEGFELDIITMVLLGGVSIFGGRGTLLGVGLSILVVLNLRNGLSLAKITGTPQTSIIGGLLIFSVLLQNLGQQYKKQLDALADYLWNTVVGVYFKRVWGSIGRRS